MLAGFVSIILLFSISCFGANSKRMPAYLLKSMPLKSQPVSCQSPSFVLLQRISPFFETVASAHVIESIATPSMANLFFGSSLVPASFPFFGAANENATAMESNRIVDINFFIKKLLVY